MSRVGQNYNYVVYDVYLKISLLSTPYMHRV